MHICDTLIILIYYTAESSISAKTNYCSEQDKANLQNMCPSMTFRMCFLKVKFQVMSSQIDLYIAFHNAQCFKTALPKIIVIMFLTLSYPIVFQLRIKGHYKRNQAVLEVYYMVHGQLSHEHYMRINTSNFI